jgi:CBS domain-containing protein
MLLKEIMTPVVDTIDSEASVDEAARLMERRNVGFLPITLEGVCAGAITDRDIVTRVIAKGLNPSTTVVREIMSHRLRAEEPAGRETNAGLISLPDHADVEEAVQVMDEQDVRRVAVHDRDYRIIGVVSRADLPASHAAVAVD